MLVNNLFYLFSIALIFTSFMVIYSKHSVFSLLFLITSFLISSFMLFLLECEFLALLFIIIYVGAIAILFLFAVMMLETKLTNLSKNTTKYIPIAFLFGLIFLVPLIYEILLVFGFNFALNPDNFYLNTYTNWYDLIDSVIDIKVYGHVLYSYFVLQFLVAGLILLLVLVGIVYLTKKPMSLSCYQASFKQLSRHSNIS